MTSQPNNKAIFALAWPIASNAVLLQLVLIIDTLLVTPLGESSLAAMGLASSIAGIIIGLLFAFSNGTQLLVAQAFGASNPLALKSAFWSGLAINAIIVVLGISFIIFYAESVLTAFAIDTVLAGLALEYLSVFTLVIAGIAISQNITAFFNAQGKSRLPFYSNLLEVPVNALASSVFIYGLWGFPALGLAGAAVGSAIAVGVRALFLVAALYRLQLDLFSTKGWSKPTFLLTIKHHFNHAIPIAGTFISMTMTMNVCMMLYAKLPISQFAALTLIFPWVRVAGHLVTAWAQATGIIVGQLLGRGAEDLLDGFVKQAWRVALVIGLLVSLLYLAISFSFAFIYPNLQVQTLDHLWSLMPILVIIPFVRTSNTMCGNVLRAGGDATHVFKIHVTTQWLMTVPLTALFVLYFELSVFWVFAITFLEEIAKALPFHLRMLSGVWKKRLVTT